MQYTRTAYKTAEEKKECLNMSEHVTTFFSYVVIQKSEF